MPTQVAYVATLPLSNVAELTIYGHTKAVSQLRSLTITYIHETYLLVLLLELILWFVSSQVTLIKLGYYVYLYFRRWSVPDTINDSEAETVSAPSDAQPLLRCLSGE